MRVAGLFSGIGGLELAFQRGGATTELICDSWAPSQRVLQRRFPNVPLHSDVRDLEALPDGVDVVTAGFPCTDLSQAGRTAGITGTQSSLVSHVFRLLRDRDVEWLVLENVRNMLVLGKGLAMAYLTRELEALGFRWAYRLVDSRFTGVPQRRHRVILVASREHDPRQILFADDAGISGESSLRTDAFGFYWTEGLRGLGWTQDAIPPLKGGSSVGIPSSPAIWLPVGKPGHKIVTPSIEATEAMQGFPRDWTSPAQHRGRNGPRWKLVGNAVTVGVAEWVVNRLYEPGEIIVESEPKSRDDRWPDAAYGEAGRVQRFYASPWPVRWKHRHLTDLVSPDDLQPLSYRAAKGFLQRVTRSSLRVDQRFLRDLERHVASFDKSHKTPENTPTAGV